MATTGSQKSILLLETRHITQVVKIGRWRSAIPRINKETKKEKRKKKERKRSTKKPKDVTCHVFTDTTDVVASPHGFACVVIPAT